MKKICTLLVALLVIVNCTNNGTDKKADVTFDLLGVKFYNEFFPCKGGKDYTPENVNKMMKAWRSQNISSDLLGAWGYAPASEKNAQENGWWELQWESKEKADAAWRIWNADKDAMAWSANTSWSLLVMVSNEEDGCSSGIATHIPLVNFLKMVSSSQKLLYVNIMRANLLLI